jgi:adenosylcobyric acid synthase
VGKSLLTTALCRIFRQDGFSVAPFKAQNMALNSAATPEGLEIGRAQAVQAEAAGIAPSADMNPILLKPTRDTGSQVIVCGRIAGEWSGAEYHNTRAQRLFGTVVRSYERLAAQHELIVLEGAGSPAEMNLQSRDIVNMRMARAADAVCLLVGDIDRGGVFASLIGTLALLNREDRARICGFVVNKFRGDRALFEDGVELLERRMKRPCLGVVPFLRDIGLEEEDGVAQESRRTVARVWSDETASTRRVRIGVVALPHLANFTDFDALAAEPSVALAFVTRPEDVARADLVVLPGCKQVIPDLEWLHDTGLARAIQRHAHSGGLTLGVCGGFQMLGDDVSDPAGLEGGGRGNGLGLLGVRTRLTSEKVTSPAVGEWSSDQIFGQRADNGSIPALRGYEIHLGVSTRCVSTRALLRLRRANGATVEDGAMSNDGRILGTYLHGFADDDRFRHTFVRALRSACDLAAAERYCDYTFERDARFDRLARSVRDALDVAHITRLIGLRSPDMDARSNC